MRSKTKSTIAFIVAGILLAACIGAAGLLVQSRSAATSFDPSPSLTVEDAEDGFPAVDWEYWQDVNPDVIGWVTVPGTPIDYPIVQAHADAPTWYLSHDVYGNWNIYGCPYLDADCEEEGFDSRVAYVFAHHMDDGSMFAPLASLDLDECREILLPAELCHRLQKWCQKYRIHTGPVFLSRVGEPLCRVTVWKLFKALCERAKVSARKVFPHNLWHLFARTFYNLEKNISKLADLLGHSSIETTRIYIMESGAEHERLLNAGHCGSAVRHEISQKDLWRRG